jgi:membrane carboxypeptidase/penicillin-binding protein
MFPNGGFAVRPRGLMRVLDADGGIAYDNPPHSERVISPETAFQMVSILEDVINRGTASAARNWGIRFDAGGKTGTTDDFKDAWFVGFSSSLVAGVWVGFDQPKTIGRDAYGSRYALPIWSDFMRRAAPRRPPEAFEVPSGLHDEQLCSVSYLRPVEDCPVYTEYFKDSDDVPSRLCTIHRGTVKQRIKRAMEGLLSGIGRKIRGIFR